MQSECDALRADIAALLVSDQDETGARQEVSFKDTNGEYDCDFEILMMEALNLASYSTAWPLVKASYEALTGKLPPTSRTVSAALMCLLTSRLRLRSWKTRMPSSLFCMT